MENSEIRILETMKKFGFSEQTIESQERFMRGLSDLASYLADIPQANKEQSIATFNMALENQKLKKMILELEETCENMNLNEIKLHEKLKAYECNDVVWRNCYEALREENRKLTDGTLDKKREANN